MERSIAVPPPGAAARTARCLLLALALAACGSGGGDQQSAGAPEEPERPAPAGGQADTCPPPPVVDTMLFHGPFEALARRLQETRVTFLNRHPNDSTTALVKLCEDCNPVKMTIVSERRTGCLQADSLREQTRIAGVFVVDSGSVTPPGWGRSFNPRDSLLVFARDTLAPAKLVYRLPSTTGGDTVGVAPNNPWTFRYCTDSHQRGMGPQGKWRQYVPSPAAAPGRSENEGERTYGWMACASGCCQFYIPPPPTPDPEKGKGREPVPPGDRNPPCPGG
ncbi:MAG TPA: hypothetical protein VHG08_11555 [Longimicrobium sp.]|nr:hypothetical protein [Longimicrobium sp.]